MTPGGGTSLGGQLFEASQSAWGFNKSNRGEAASETTRSVRHRRHSDRRT